MAALTTEAAQRLVDLGICDMCIILFMDGNAGVIKLARWTAADCSKYLARTRPRVNFESRISLANDANQLVRSNGWEGSGYICPCCRNAINKQSLYVLATGIIADFKEYSSIEAIGCDSIKISLDITAPNVLDALKAVYRMAGNQNTTKQITFPPYQDVVKAILSNCISEMSEGKITVADQALDAMYKVQLLCCLNGQNAIVSSLLGSTIRRKRAREDDHEDNYDMTRVDVDRILAAIKDFNDSDVANIMTNCTEYVKVLKSRVINGCTWKISIHRCSSFLLGRYRKLSRDVPQTPWMVGEERLGRSSVEEIISSSVCEVLQSPGPCKIHGCGREDIDVRCLGNGRPFVLEVSNYKEDITDERLAAIIQTLNSGQGLNSNHDVELVWLKRASKEVWEKMQEVAEEKKKAYSCIVWSERVISQQNLRDLERISSKSIGLDKDEDGQPCLQIAQKTPLRVLHRRSLLTRPRYIYDISCTLLNEHYFIMRLTTSSGTYVKEFVHGDLGRTEPSLSSILKCKTEILQLDVTGLFDEFEGGQDHEALRTDENQIGLQAMADRAINTERPKPVPIARWKGSNQNLE